MEYTFSFEEITPFFRLRAYANKGIYRWECGGSFASDWAEKKWYEGLLVFQIDEKQYIFFFKSFEVRDEELPEFTLQSLFGTDLANREIFMLCQKKAQKPIQSPFPFIEIGRDFTPISIQMLDAEVRIAHGEDGFG